MGKCGLLLSCYMFYMFRFSRWRRNVSDHLKSLTRSHTSNRLEANCGSICNLCDVESRNLECTNKREWTFNGLGDILCSVFKVLKSKIFAYLEIPYFSMTENATFKSFKLYCGENHIRHKLWFKASILTCLKTSLKGLFKLFF